MKPLLFISISAIGLLISPWGSTVQAQVPLSQSTAFTTNRGRNIIRIDWLTPLSFNFAYNFFEPRELLFPVLASYERSVAARWSVGGEVLLNGGYPDSKRNGASLSARYYFLRIDDPVRLSGAYVSPVAGYLNLRVRNDAGFFDAKARRMRTGILVGWQGGILKSTSPRFVMDLAAGIVQWSMLGTDHGKNPNRNALDERVLSPGIRFDARAAIGYQF